MFWSHVCWAIYCLLATYAVIVFLPFVTYGRFRYYACYALFNFSEGFMSALVAPLALYFYRDPKCLGITSDIIRTISYPLGITWEIRNKEKLKKGTKAIIVANHQSVLDILGMQYMHRFMGTYTSLAKKELLYVIPWGPSAWLGGLIFLDRNNPRSKMNAMKEAMSHFNKNGTRNSSQTDLLPFKKGAFHMAIDCQTPIIPVVFSPYSFIDHEKKEFSKGKVIISVLDEIEVQGLTTDDVNQLVDKTHKMMNEEFRRLSTETVTARNY